MKRILLILAILAIPTFSIDARKPQNRAEWIVAQINNPNSKYVLVAAHRADWRNWPENSLPAMQSAIDMGADIIELDIQKTKDGVLVVCHDNTLDRTTTEEGKISDLTFEEVRKAELKTGHGIGTILKVPTLIEALELCKDKIVVNIDKGYDYYDDILAITDSMGVTDQILLKGGNAKKYVDAKFASHSHNMMYLPVCNLGSTSGRELLDSYLEAEKPELAYEICWTEKDQEYAEEQARRIIADGSKVYINTLWATLNGGYCDDSAYYDEDRVYGKIVEMGATIIQSDRPALLIKWLHKHHRHKALGKAYRSR